MTLQRRWYNIQYNTSASNQQIDDFRQDMINGCIQYGVKGYFVIDEGEMWIHLEGDGTDIDQIARAVENDSLTTSLIDTEYSTNIQSVTPSNIFTYHEDRPPISG